MYIVMFSEAPLPPFELADSVSALCERTLHVCDSLGGTPFVLLAITILCIAISCVVWKMNSLIYLKIFAVS